MKGTVLACSVIGDTALEWRERPFSRRFE